MISVQVLRKRRLTLSISFRSLTASSAAFPRNGDDRADVVTSIRIQRLVIKYTTFSSLPVKLNPSSAVTKPGGQEFEPHHSFRVH